MAACRLSCVIRDMSWEVYIYVTVMDVIHSLQKR